MDESDLFHTSFAVKADDQRFLHSQRDIDEGIARNRKIKVSHAWVSSELTASTFYDIEEDEATWQGACSWLS